LVHKRSPRAKKERKRKRLLKKNFFDRDTGEVINLHEHFVDFEVVPKDPGFLNVDLKYFNIRGLICLHEGEVLIDKQGKGTIQTRPEVFV